MSDLSPLEQARLDVRVRPDRSPCMYQSWRDLLFLHWKADPALVQAMLPAGLTVDTFDGDAWFAIVPFLMRRIRPAGLPSIPYLSNFLELNVRTYAVDENGVPGVWFTSLNANRLAAVKIARRFFGLPYYWARMATCSDPEGGTLYRCHRDRTSRFDNADFSYTVDRTAEAQTSRPGTLDFFLLERYVLFSQIPGRGIMTGHVSHAPYPVLPVTVHRFDSHLAVQDGFPLPSPVPDHAAFSAGVDVEVFALQGPAAGALPEIRAVER